jgi:hypothetical protein
MTTPTESSTYGALHAGDVVLGFDGRLWGVAFIGRGEAYPRFRVDMVAGHESMTGYPTPDTAVSVVSRADTAPEAYVFELFTAAGIEPELISEKWKIGRDDLA